MSKGQGQAGHRLWGAQGRAPAGSPPRSSGATGTWNPAEQLPAVASASWGYRETGLGPRTHPSPDPPRQQRVC